jgi:twitching motility two-component system response regulator PilG
MDTNNSSSQQAGELALKLLVLGFTQFERQLLSTIVNLSKRRQPQLQLLDAAFGELADVVMIDTADTNAMKWSGKQQWLAQKVVIWVDAPHTPDTPRHSAVQRPVQWPALPVMLARALEQDSMKKTSALPTSGCNSVLIVDDSIAIRAQLRSLLEPYGLAVTDFDNAEAAIGVASTSLFGCILMDVVMPGMDGYEACRRIKANKFFNRSSNVVMLTSKTSPFDHIMGKMAGCDAYLSKPIDPKLLYEVISRYVAKPVAGGILPREISHRNTAISHFPTIL